MLTRRGTKRLTLKDNFFECFQRMWNDFKIDPKKCDAEKPHDPLHFFHPKKKHQLVFRLIQHIFIFELIERFSDVHVMERDYIKFYPIHYFSKEFFRNYQLFLNDAEHVFIEFPGIVDSSGSIVDYTKLDTFGKKVFFLFQHWMYFSHRAGGRSFSNLKELCDKISQWCLFLHILHIFINFGYEGLDKFRKRNRILGMKDLDRYVKNGEEYFPDGVFDEVDRAELYDEIVCLSGVERVAIKFNRYRKSIYVFLCATY